MNSHCLTSDRLRELVHYDRATGLFKWAISRGHAKAGAVAGQQESEGYVVMRIDGRRYFAHRLAWLYVTGEWPPAQVDHRNCIRSDNKWANLRLATNAENKQNMRRARADNKAGLLGVSPDRMSWRAQIRLDGKRKHLGNFSTPEAAHAAYLAEKERIHPFQTITQQAGDKH